MLFYAKRLPGFRPDTAAVSLIFGTERLPINPHVFENLQLLNCVANHWSKSGAIRQLEAQKRTYSSSRPFRYGPQRIVDRYEFRRILHTSVRREKLRSLTDLRPISVTPILCRVLDKSFVQKWLKRALFVEALNDQYAISKREALTAHLTNAVIISLTALSKMITSRLLVNFT
jgi:hypothetical protein